MNPPSRLAIVPPEVSATKDYGVYLVKSGSRTIQHRFDVNMLQCECESARMGKSHKAFVVNGRVHSWHTLCPHGRLALAAHGALHVLAQKPQTEGP